MKLSDALRGAADRAPVDDATISVEAATGRVRRRRAVRAGSTGVVGAGAVAVIALGAMGPLAGTDANDSFAGADATAESAMDGEMGAPAMAEEDSAAGDTRLAEQWMCGSPFDPSDPAWAWGDASGVTYSVGEPEADGEQHLLPSTLVAERPVDLISSPDYLVVWDGIIVGRMVNPDPLAYGPADEPMLPDEVYERLDPSTDFSELEQATVMETVNCWDGAPLPAATYEVHQAWTLAYATTADAGDGPGDEPLVEDIPTDEPTDVPTEEAPDDGATDDGVVSGEGSEASGSAVAPSLEASSPELFRVAADPVSLVIDGDPVDDPFGGYLGHEEPGEPVPLPEPIDPVEPEPLPDGYLTPDIARELFEANRVDGPWDMAAGSQRVVKANDARSDNPDGEWQENFYGCVWDDADDGRFPERSAELELLDVSVSVPSSISVSYGFVVDDNPLLNSSVTNVSRYTIPGFWSGPSPQLYLVRDGVVVAEAYPMGLDDQLATLARESTVMDDADDQALTVLPESGGTLAPGADVSGRYLWRDVTACGARGTMDAGTYTLLTAQSISLSNQGQVVMYSEGDSGDLGGAPEPRILEPEPALDLPLTGADGSAGDGAASSGFADSADPAIAPAPMPEVAYDWLELQIYTSLGAVTVR